MSRDQWILLGLAVYGVACFCAWALVASGAEPQPESQPKRAAPKLGAGDKAPRHKTPDCYGAWVRQYADDCFLVCNRCRARAIGSQIAEARLENERSLALLAATREGMALLQRERKGAA